MIFLLPWFFFFSCKKEKQDNQTSTPFIMQAQYDSIRSCPGGGGLFIMKFIDTISQGENISVNIDCDKKLNASLSKIDFVDNKSVFEVLIHPDNNIANGNYTLSVICARGSFTESYSLKVKIIAWDNPTELGDIAKNKKRKYIDWLNSNYPDIEINNETEWDLYSTYPGILIVEHFTLLNDTYEMRICNHAMIPPDDWSMIRLRYRNSEVPFLAARQDSTNGKINEILVKEYPVLFGY